MPPSSGLLLTHGVSLKMGIKMGSGLPIFLCVPPTSFPPHSKKLKRALCCFAMSMKDRSRWRRVKKYESQRSETAAPEHNFLGTLAVAERERLNRW